jgi:hypothetical protein
MVTPFCPLHQVDWGHFDPHQENDLAPGLHSNLSALSQTLAF